MIPSVMGRVILCIFIALLGIAAAGGGWALLHKPSIPVFSIKGLSDSDLRKQTGLVTFFASWCVPCEAEHPVLMDLSRQGVPLFGISFLDASENRTAFLDRLGNPYEMVGEDEKGSAGAAWEIEGLPVTFMIAGGRVVERHDGPLTGEYVRATLLPLLERKRVSNSP